MQRLSIRFMFVPILAVIMFISGCGSDGDVGLNEIGYSFMVTSIEPKDRDESTNDFDLIMDCPDGDTGYITDSTATITFKSGTSQEYDMWVYEIEIEFDMVDYAGTVADENTVTLPSRTRSVSILVPSAGGSNTVDIDLVAIGEKADFLDRVGTVDIWAEFEVHITAKFTSTPDDPDEHYSASYSYSSIKLANFVDGSCDAAEE